MQENNTQQKLAEYALVYKNSDLNQNTFEIIDPSLNIPVSQQKFYKLIAEFSENWISWISPEHKISFMSPACRLISGYDPGEFGEDPDFLKKIIHPKELGKLIREEQKISQGFNMYSGEFRIIKKTGEVKWISLLCQNVYDVQNEFLGKYIRIKDISEKMNPNLIVLNKERLAQDIYQNASLGYYEVYYDGNLKTTNKVFLEMLGYESAAQFADRNFEEFCVLNRDKREEFKNLLKKYGKIKDYESEWIKKDWSIAYFRESANVVASAEGVLPYYQVVVHDITEQKNAEYAYMTASAKKRKIEELKAEFLATMSHEIRTPLNVILNMVSLLKNESVLSESSETTHSIKIIEEEGVRIQRTIDLILEMSQLQTGTYEKNISEIDLLGDVFNPLYKVYTVKAIEKNIEFNLINKLQDTRLTADKYGVNQIFSQLIDNAFKYTSSGKIDAVIYRNDKNQITVEIADTGIGINEEYIPLLFAVFSQEDNSYTRLFEGTGLGLAIVKKHCELNNAVIEVESRKNEGTKFRVSFTVPAD